MDEKRKFTIGGKEVTLSKRSVEEAVRNVEPGPIKKHSVVIRGVRYPIKQVISLASGQPTAVFIATDAYRILRRLGFDVASETPPSPGRNVKLTLHWILRSRRGSDYGTGPVTQYRVGGMPQGESALIRNFGGRHRSEWKILRIHDDVQDEWTGQYESAEAALAELQKEYA